ncbi:MAG: HIT family protein [Butyrivibrio sp.]
MCEFCKIINKQLPAYVVYEDEQLISFSDIAPIHEGHVIIVPKQHVECKTVESFVIMDMLIFMYFPDTIMMALDGHILRVSQSILIGLQRSLGIDCR